MKPHWRGRFRVALEPLRERFEPNPFVNPPSIDVQMSGDIRHRPALAKEFMHPGKQPLKALQPVGAIEVRAICPVLWRDNLDENAYCLTWRCSPLGDGCLIYFAPAFGAQEAGREDGRGFATPVVLSMLTDRGPRMYVEKGPL
jgi:hypothetical protein